jgi:anti-sigma B factor antagonist
MRRKNEGASMNGLTLTYKDIEPVRIISVEGYLDAHTATKFEQEIESSISQKKMNILVNLQKCEYISSAGLGVFMGFLEEIRENGGDLKISDASDKVYKVFDLLGFPNIFEIYKTENEAMEKFSTTDNK